MNLLRSSLNTEFLLFKNIFNYEKCINNNDVNKNFFKIIDYNKEEILFSVLNDFEPEERVALADLMERFTLSVDAAVKAKKHRHH